MGYFDANLELRVYFKGSVEVRSYPALIERGNLSFSHLPTNAVSVTVHNVSDRNAPFLMERWAKNVDGQWVRI